MDGVIRRDDWPERLQQEVEAAKTRPFSWGVFDCCLFAADCVQAMTGHDYAEDFRGRYLSRFGAMRCLKHIGAGDIGKTLDNMLEPIEPGLAGRGDLCLLPWRADLAIGVVIDHRCAVPAVPAGLAFVPKRDAVRAWRV